MGSCNIDHSSEDVLQKFNNKQGNLPKKIAIYTKAACQESPEHHDSK